MGLCSLLKTPPRHPVSWHGILPLALEGELLKSGQLVAVERPPRLCRGVHRLLSDVWYPRWIGHCIPTSRCERGCHLHCAGIGAGYAKYCVRGSRVKCSRVLSSCPFFTAKYSSMVNRL